MSELMQGSNLILIAAVEITVVLLLLCLFLLFQNRRLRDSLQRLRSRMEQLVKDLKTARSLAAKSQKQAPSGDYKHFLNLHLANVRDRHSGLQSDRDIVLDIDPDTPAPRRVAALRYAVLMAEKEATAKKGSGPDWTLLERKYQQIFDFNQEYAVSAEPAVTADTSELDDLRGELTSAKKRINNLERFKALYFDLEEKWENCRDTAQTHLHELSQLAAQTENSDQLESVIKSYHESYGDIGRLIEAGVDGQSLISGQSDSSGEIKHLRAVAADQHKIITELQRKLQEATSTEAQIEIVEELQGQLQKQMRFVQESETCIQLMEDELGNANKELEQLRARLNVLPQIKANLKDMREQNDDYEMQVHSLKSENRRLKNKIQSMNNAPPQTDGEARKLKKELAAAEARFAELEEKFLDLKLQP